MKAEEFLRGKGDLAQSKVRFLNAGAPTMIPLVDLLNEFASFSHHEAAPANKKKGQTSKAPTNKKK